MAEKDSDTIRINIKLIPKAARNDVKGWVEDEKGVAALKCSVTAVPENGKANAALIKLLSKYYKLPKSNIKLIKGETSRLKTLEISGADADMFLQQPEI